MSSTWPKLSPFSQANDQLLFVTFSSKIDYGYALVNTGPSGVHRAQLWMAAIDLRAVEPGGDPSLPPFWLSFQDITETNHLPFWTAQVACTADGVSYAHCGADEVCEKAPARSSRRSAPPVAAPPVVGRFLTPAVQSRGALT